MMFRRWTSTVAIEIWSLLAISRECLPSASKARTSRSGTSEHADRRAEGLGVVRLRAESRRQVPCTLGNGADGLDHFIGRGRLDDIAHCAGFEHAVHDARLGAGDIGRTALSGGVPVQRRMVPFRFY